MKNQLVASKALYLGFWNTKYPIGGYFAWSLLILDGFGAASSWHKIAGVATSRNSPRRRVENREKRELAIEPNFI